nr:replication protein A 70 kDa DNA-binding subunit B [Tanacetum cinerariifolium]
MLDDIKIQGQCITLWHSHPAGKPKHPYSLDFVLQDQQGNRIQCTIKLHDMPKFEPLLKEGDCYQIFEFSVRENNGKQMLPNHIFKITFVKSTIVTRIDSFDDDIFGFKIEPFNDILSKKFHETDSADVIGTVVAIGDVVVVPNSLVKKERRSVVIENTDNNKGIGPVTFVLQLTKVKYWLDEPAVHNSLFGSRIFINKDISEITGFKKRYTSKDGYEKNDHKIELFSPEKVKITHEMFFKDNVKSMVVGIRDVEPVRVRSSFYAKIHRIHKEHGWCYNACKHCYKMAKPINGHGSASSGRKSKSTASATKPKKSSRCDEHGVIYQVVPRFNVILRVIDEADSGSLVMFDTNVSKIYNGISAFEVMNKHGENTSDYFMDDLNVIVRKKYLFKVLFTQHNVDSNIHSYSCKAVLDEDELINHFNTSFYR